MPALRTMVNDETTSQFLRAIIDSVADPIFVKDEQHRWIEFNRAFCELMGHPREHLLGKSGDTSAIWGNIETARTSARSGALPRKRRRARA